MKNPGKIPRRGGALERWDGRGNAFQNLIPGRNPVTFPETERRRPTSAEDGGARGPPEARSVPLLPPRPPTDRGQAPPHSGRPRALGPRARAILEIAELAGPAGLEVRAGLIGLFAGRR